MQLMNALMLYYACRNEYKIIQYNKIILTRNVEGLIIGNVVMMVEILGN